MWDFILGVFFIFISFVGIIIHTTTKHANKHPEAEQVRKAFRKNGAFQIWQEKVDKKTFHYVVELENGIYGDWVVSCENGTNYEKTVFVPKDGKLSSIENWLKSKADKL